METAVCVSILNIHSVKTSFVGIYVLSKGEWQTGECEINVCVIIESSIARLVYCHHQIIYCLFIFILNRIWKAVIEIIGSHAVFHFEVNTSGKSVAETERQQFHL